MHSWRNGRRSRLRSGRPRGMEVQVLPGAPTIARFAKRPRHRFYIPTFPGSSPGASTKRFVSLAAKAPARHAGDPRFESATKHQHFSRSSKAERPADNRKTAVRYRAGEPTQEITMTTIKQMGRLAAAPPSLMDPERSSLSRLGNGLLIRAQEVQLLPGPPTHAHD